MILQFNPTSCRLVIEVLSVFLCVVLAVRLGYSATYLGQGTTLAQTLSPALIFITQVHTYEHYANKYQVKQQRNKLMSFYFHFPTVLRHPVLESCVKVYYFTPQNISTQNCDVFTN